ncbi:MAG TPA: PAS domain-containing sensor histidine kinase [Lentisphaerae bacterium]|nr:PAS domain-containing sensor histidine kinase [Lentisphaerota bacterium]
MAKTNPPAWWMERRMRYSWDGKENRPLGAGWVSFTLVKIPYRPSRAVVICDAAVSGQPFDPVAQASLAMLCVYLGSHLEWLTLFRELEQEQARLLAMFDGLELVVYVVDPDTYEVIYCNPYLRRLLGSDPQGKICYREFQNRDEPCDFCTTPWIKANPGKTLRWEFFNPKCKRHFLIFDRLIPWPDGRDVRFEVAVDITREKKLEEQRLMAQAYEHAMEARSHALSQIAHELRSPMNVLLGTVQASLRGIYGELTEPQRKAMDRILQSGRVLSGLIDELLQMGREVVGEVVLEKRPVPVAVLVNSVLPLAEAELGVRRDTIQVSMPDEISGLLVDVDQRRIQQILINLLVNASRHSPGTGIELRVSRLRRSALAEIERNLGSEADEWLVISLTDRGRGLSPRECEAIFHGIRLSGPKDTPGPLHLGIGLPLSRKIAVWHGGWLWAESPGPGKGSTFHLALPLGGGREEAGHDE